MKKYKVLNSDLTSPYQEFKYKIGKEHVCKNFDTDKTRACSRGFYATDIEGLPYSWNIHRRCFEVEVSGKQVIIDQYKQRFEKQTIIREVFRDELIGLAKAEEDRLGYKLSEVLFPINPLLIKTGGVTDRDIELLKQWALVWASVRDSVRDSVWASVRASVRDSVVDSVGHSVGHSVGDSVGASVRDSVGHSVWDSVRDSVVDSVGASVGHSVGDSVGASVRDSVGHSVGASVWVSVGHSVGASVWDSVRGYISSIFPNIEEWKYVDHKKGENPFQPCIDLWRSGFVPSFDGKTWRLHTSEKADVVYELTQEEK